jgi:hypothetical protein
MIGHFILMEQFGAGLNTVAANIHTGTGDEPRLVLPLAAEATANRLFFGFCHAELPPFGSDQ